MLTSGFYLIVPPIIIIFITLFLELHLSSGWNRFYFTKGIVLFKKLIPFAHSPNLSSETLSMNFSKESSHAMVFHQLSLEEIAFREEYESFRLSSITPVIHGLIKNKEGNLEIIGLLNWFPIISSLVVVIMLVGIAFDTSFMIELKLSSILFAIGPVMIFRDLYKDQEDTYNKVYDLLLEFTGNQARL